jgi:GNAT superfamily N-acetyltransferase
MAGPKQWVAQPWNPASESEERAILAMNAANQYRGVKCSPEFYDWQYRRNPAGEAVIKLAVDQEDAEKLAGIYVVIPVGMVCKGRAMTCALSLNTLTDSQYRGQGIFTGLAREVYQSAAERGIPMVIGYPNPNSYHGFVNRLEFKDIVDVPLLIRVLRLSEVVAKRFPVASLRGVVKAVAKLGNSFFRLPATEESEVERVERFDDAFDELNERLCERFPILVKRDSSYLNWRYVDVPIEYRPYAIRENGRVMGYLVYRVMEFARMRCGMILDFVVRGEANSRDVGQRLIRYGLAEMWADQCDVAAALCLQGSVEFRLLRSSRFLECPRRLKPQPFPYIVRRNILEHDFDLDVFDIHNWFVSMGDYDAA